MQKSKIEYVDYTLNPVRGLCPMGCSYCYARRLYQRFKWNPEIDYVPPYKLGQLLRSIKKPSRIFMGSTMELFGPWVDPVYREFLLGAVDMFPQHTFIFLTKMPQNLPREWPDNCWVGVTATNGQELLLATNFLYSHRIAKTQFISIEPLLSWGTSHWIHPLPQHISKKDIDWLIIGQQTPASKKTEPKIEWIWEIVEAADKAGVPVFLKDNLKPLIFKDAISGQAALDTGLLNWGGELRQELPEGAAIPLRIAK